MLEKSDTSISEALQAFNEYDLEVALIVATDTAMKKSIMDATINVRDRLLSAGFHDYESQGQGPDNKVKRAAWFVRPDSLEETTVSLYRPETKNGDPRIWFGLLGRYAQPFNLLALHVDGDDIYVVNCSDKSLMATLANPATPLGKLAAKAKKETNPVVAELLELIRGVSSKGYVKTLRAGDTGIGMTLETMLGIRANSRQAPDYKGIEIKSKRSRGVRNRSTLFSQKPDWKLSPAESAFALLKLRGAEVDGRLQLYHELNAKGPNSYGLMLQVDYGSDWLKQIHFDKEAGPFDRKKSPTSHDATWELEKLRLKLVEKHRETFWVSALCRGAGADEEFHYIRVEHTKQPRVSNFEALIDGGVISLDYTMSLKPSGKSVRDHGYLFKINPKDFGALFPPSQLYEFC